MPGALCNGKDTDQPYINRSRAYCQGQQYRLSGTAAARPKTNNPYGAEQPVAKIDWDRGWDAIDAQADQVLTRATTGCCPGEGQTVPGAA